MAISLRSAIGSGELPLNPVQEDVYEGFSQATASPLQQGWHTASLGGAANSAYTKALMAKDAGDLEGFDANMAEAQALQQQAAGWTPKVQDYRKVNDLNSGLRYAAQGLGSAANSSLPSLVGGAVGGIGAAMIAARSPMMAAKTVGRLATTGGFMGAAIPGYNMEMEEAAGQAAQDERIMATRTPDEILDAARVKGGINMLGEAAVPAMLMGKIGGTGLKQAFKSPMAALTALPGAIGQGMLTEGATEGAQNIVGQMTQNQLRRDPLDNIDYHEATNDALIGAMFGGGMGTVGGAADLAHRSMATVGQGAQDVAGSDVLQNGIAKGFAKGKELAGQGADIITELGKKGMAFAKEDAAQIKAAYNELGVEGAMVIAEDLWAKRTSDAARTVGDLATGAADVAKTKVGEHLSTLSNKLDNALGLNADEISDKLSENPFIKNNQMTDDDFMKHVGGNGDSAVALATELRDSGLLDATPEASRMLLDSVLANPDSLKRDQAKQAQVAAIHHTMKNNIDLVDQLDEMVTNLSIYQDKSGKKFSKQSSPEITAARESLKEALASFGITDKQLVGRITASVGINGKNAALKQALVRELLGKGIDNKTVAAIGEAGFIDESAPQQTREEKRANESANREARRTAAANPFMTSDIEAYVNEAVKGTDQDSSLVKGGIVHAISSILTAAHSDMITEGEIDKFRTFIKNKLGERGDQLVESILNHDVLSGEGKAKKLGDSSREDRVMTKLAGLNSEGKLNSGRMKEAVRELANAHTDARVAEAVDKKKEYASAEVKAKEMMFSGVEGSSGKALRHLDRAKKARDADPWSKFNEIAGKYFNDPKEFGRLKALIGEYNGEARANAKHTSAGNPASVTPTEAMTGEDLDNYDVNQSTAENVDTTSDTAEIAAKEEQETGANKDNVVAEPTRFYGQTAKDPGKYNKYPGAPLTTHATYDHPSGEFDTMMKHVETKNVGSRMGSLNPIQWADEVAQHDGVKSDTLLDGAAKATIQHDAETKAKLQAMLASGKNLARRTPQGQQTHEQVEAAIIEQIKHIDLRKELLNSENGSGYGFFTNRMNRHFRYASTNAATGKILMVDERMLDRFRVGNIATAADKYASKFGKEGSEEYAVRYDEFSNSIITLKDSDGSSFKFDIAGLVSSMVSRNQPADITGVGDSKATAMFFTDLKVALSNVITSLYTSDLLSKNDPFDTASGEQASLNKIGNSVKQKEFALKPSLVIYRNPKSSVTTEDGSHLEAGAQVYTYGQVFGMVGARAAKAVHKTAMATPLTVMELQSIMPGTTAAPKGATAAQKIVANKKREGTSLMVAKNVLEDVHGNKFNLQPSTLLRAMLERHGIPEDAIGVIGEDTNGMSNELAGALLSDGFALLKEAGFTLNADLSSAVLGPKVLWENSSFQTTVSQVNKTVNLPGAPKESQYRYTGSYDMVADRTTVALEKVTAATKALSKAQALRAEELADPIGYGRGTKARVTEAEINELKEKLEAANNDLLNSRNFGEADITHNETRKITRQTQGQVASDIKTKAPIYGTIDEKAEVERATDADQTDPDNRVNSGVHDRSTIRHAFLAQERAKHRAAKAQDIRAKRAAARSKVEPATISPVNIGPKDTSAGLSPEQRAAQRDSANKASEGKGGVAPMPATPAHVANPQPNLTNTKPATMQQTREVAAADASPKVAAHRAAAARALAAKRAEARRDRAAKAAEAVVEPVVEQEAEVETTRAKPVDNKVAFDIVNEKPMTVKELLTKDHWQDVSFERLVASLSYMAKMPALNLLRAIESVDPDYARELKNAVFPDDPNGGGTKFSKQTTKGEPGYMDRVQGYGTLRNGAVVALIGKFGPIANAAVGYDTIDGASRVFIYDADLLKQGLSASKTLVDRFTMQNSFKGDVSTAEISADGVENSTSGVFSKYKHLLSKVKGKDGLTYNKFKEGSFSNHEIRDVIRMLRDTANDAGLLENIKQIALYRATGANPSAPIRFVPKEQLMRFSKQKDRPKDTLHDNDSGLQADHERRLGSTVTMFLRDILPGGYAGQYSPKSKTAKGLIEVSRTAPNERGTLAHEDWHGVEELLLEMGPEGQKIIDTIHKGVQDPRTVAWIKQQLIERGENPNDPDGAFSQLNDPSELAAFAFQFFVENDGKMTLPPRTRSLFEKIAAFVKKLAGIKEDIVKAENFFKFFDTGEFQKNMENPLSVVQSLQETTREKYLNQLNEVVKPVRALAFAAFGHTADRIKAINIPAYNEILKRMSEGSDGHAGYTEEQRARMYSFGNKYAAIVGGMEQKDLTPATKTKVQALIREIEQYKKDAGVKGWDLGRTSFPPVFELSKIEGKLAEFKQDLRAYGNMTGSEADLNNMVNQILYEGYAKGNDALFRDNPEKLAKWVSDDQTKHAFSYFKASTQAAEMARAFKGKSLEDLLEEGDAKATISDKQVIRTFVDASMGRAGMNMSPELRKLFGAVTTAINMSLLPFALFSQMVEPLQLAFRKNDVASAVNSAFRGMRDLPRTFNSVNAGVRKDIWENIALDLGMVSDAAAVSMISDVMNEVPLRGKMDKANAMFFRYIGMEQWARSMHVASTQNALEFIKQHDKNPTENGNRLMEELGLKGKTIDYVNGIPDHNDPLVRAAVIHFVNESMAHPDPSTNTVWMNDPRFALLAHLKRFTFGFSYYINRRAMNDIKAGRYKELLPLAMFVPWKLATEGLKDMIKPGDEAYKANWTATDYIADSINKSGLTGRYGLGIDAGINMSHGGSGLEAVSPTAEMSGKLARAANEGHGWRTAIEQIPGGKLVTQ